MSLEMSLPMQELIGRLSEADKKVLKESTDGHWVYPARTIAANTQLPLFVVRKAQRHMRSLGILDYGFLMEEERGMLAGRGYHRTILGNRVLEALPG